MNIQKVGVVGAGTMGSGIAHVFARGGLDVVLCDVEQSLLERALGTIAKNLDREVAKDKITVANRDSALGRIQAVADRARLAACDFVVEAATEKFEIKAGIFRELDALMRPEVILASNTSSISITKLAALTKRPGKVVGMHFFNPVPVMKLVEVIQSDKTDPAIAKTTVELCSKFGKTPILVKDIPGFIVNRFLCLIYNESCNMILNGSAGAEEIDQAMKLGCNWPMGPNEIMDLAGVDVCGFAMEAMYKMTGEERYKPSPLFKKMIDEKKLGRKTGKGFYEYTKK